MWCVVVWVNRRGWAEDVIACASRRAGDLCDFGDRAPFVFDATFIFFVEYG